MNTLYKNIGYRISQLRHENGLTQAQLAEKLDISVKHISETERGLACLSLEKLVVLCEILSANLDYIVRGIDNRDVDFEHIPSFALDLFNPNKNDDIDLLKEYLLLYKKIHDAK